jgi:hypothetical protein
MGQSDFVRNNPIRILAMTLSKDSILAALDDTTSNIAKLTATLTELQKSERHPITMGFGTNSAIREKIQDMCFKRYLNLGDIGRVECDFLSRVLRIASCDQDKKYPKLMVAFLSSQDLERARPTIGKPAKLLGKILPNATEQEKEAFAVWWKETLILPYEGLNIKSTQDGDEIARVYTAKQARASDPSLSQNGWKSLSASCMRYSFNELSCHPTKVYGSGDFVLYWVENQKGEIAARAMVATRNGRFVPAPIYTNSNIAGKTLQDHLDLLQKAPRVGKDVESTTWVNCELLKIESDCGGYIAPYFDVFPYAKETDSALKICKSGNADFELQETRGVLNSGGCECYECGCRVFQEDAFHDNDGDTYCEDCYHENFGYCECCHEDERRADMSPVLNHHGHPVESYCNYCLNEGRVEDVCEVDGQFYEIDAVIFDVYDTPHLIGSDSYFISNISEDVFPMSEAQELPNGDLVTQEEALGTGNWLLVTEKTFRFTRTLYDGSFEDVYVYKQKLVLKPWLELDSGGDVINRQQELFPDIGRDGVEADNAEPVFFTWANTHEVAA